MDYSEVLKYLLEEVPMFQKVGKTAYKEGLDTTLVLDAHFNHPHKNYDTIHVAGTNGKGSCSHTLASILQQSGYKVGLFTSPHMIDFRERIRVNGEKISEDFVAGFVSENLKLLSELKPSFFELTTAMAFKYFEECNVDIAVVEVGMGGRLDCTNIITPRLSVITNISLDHTQFLGCTISQIACEKAGIIKSDIPVVIGEYCDESKDIFEKKAKEVSAPIIFAEDHPCFKEYRFDDCGGIEYKTFDFGCINAELEGIYQIKNTNTILTAIKVLIKLGYKISNDDVRLGFCKVCKNTGLMGRWQILNRKPFVVCDAGHNIGGIKYIVEQLDLCNYDNLYVIIGMVNDKDIKGVLSLLPAKAYYIFTKASINRALDEEELYRIASSYGLKGEKAANVASAFEKAKSYAHENDMIFVGGSCFIVADLLSYINS